MENRRVMKCEDCHILYVIEDSWFQHYCHLCSGHLEEMCVLHRKREKGAVGSYEKCDYCNARFICLTSIPYARG